MFSCIGKNLADPAIKKSKLFLPNLKYQFPRLANTERYKVVTLSLFFTTFCDMSLTTACAIFCSLKFHVVYTCTLWRHHLPPDKSENDQDSDSD
jgi:hypothetical protein